MIVVTLGTFDLLHRGHIRLFERCAQLGELHVAVNSDKFTLRYKCVRPAQTQQERMAAVSQHPAVARVFLNDGPGFKAIRSYVKTVAQRREGIIIAVGSDWHSAGYCEQLGFDETDFFDKYGLSVLYFPRTRGVSSSALRASL